MIMFLYEDLKFLSDPTNESIWKKIMFQKGDMKKRGRERVDK